MAKRQLPSPEALRQLLRYEPETGGLFWKERGIEWFRDGRFPASWAQRKWNTRYAGTQAFLAARPDGYLAGTVLNQALKAHRVVWAMCSGSWPVNQIDHINGIRTDNRFENLRDVTHSENGRNQKASGLGSSGITGVTYFKRDGTWRAHIKVNKRFIHIGYFSCKEAATKARKKAEADFGFHPNHGRRP